MEKNEQLIKSYLQRISNMLIINGGFLDSPGLYFGEMSLVLFFFQYARFTQNELYTDYSFDLIEIIQSRISYDTPIGYEHGLTGIGSAFEYLVQNGFIEANTDETLEEFDKKIFSLNNLTYSPVEEILGIGYYALWKISGKSIWKNIIKQTVFPQILYFLEEKCKTDFFSFSLVSIIKDIIYNNSMINEASIILDRFQQPNKDKMNSIESKTYSILLEKIAKNENFDKNTFNLGIHDGLSGLGMSLLSNLDGNNSWLSLIPNDFFLIDFNL